VRNSVSLARFVSFASIASIVVILAACTDDETPSSSLSNPDASPPVTTADASPPVTCNSAGVALCAGACVNTADDPTHCGGCDKACTATETCANGACIAACTVAGKTYPADAVSPASSCEVCAPATSATAFSPRADGTPCNPGQICKAGVCAPKCFIGGVVYEAGAPNAANDCEVCTPGTSTTAFTPRAAVPLLVGGDNVVTQGWTIVQQGPNALSYGADHVKLQTSTTAAASTSGELLLSRANAVDPTKAFKIRVTLQVESASNHNSFDSGAAILGSLTAPFGVTAERGQMIYLDSAAIGWADDSQTAAFTVTDGTYHVYELAVDAAKVATLSVDGVQKLTRNDFTTNGTIAVGDQTNDPNVDGVMRIKSVERVCP
jgi:hypothetical protein